MKWIFDFALRNVMRNKKRSFLTALSIGVAAVFSVLAFGLMGGMINTYFDGYVKYQTGNMRVVTSEYAKRQRFFPVDEIVYDSDVLKQKIEALDNVKSVEERIQFGIILGYGENSAPAIGMGTDLKENVLDIQSKLVEGELADSGLYIGTNLAVKLGVKVGDELVLAANTSEGGLNGIKLQVKGIFRFGMGIIDKKYFFIGTEDAKKLLKIYEGTTSLYVFTEDSKDMNPVAGQIRPLLEEGVVVETMADQMGSMYLLLSISKYMFMFFISLILVMGGFVMINTMMMNIFERMHEIGTLKAMGMKDKDIFMNFTIEGFILGAMGGIIGAALGLVWVILVARNGWDLTSAMSNIDFPIDYIIYPKLNVWDIVISMVLVLYIPALAAMWPAYVAKKLTPVEALRD